MNANLPDDHASIRYYDSDYPSPHWSDYPENVDDIVPFQGIAHDIARYLELAGASSRPLGSPVLELCCGTGRVAIPLARAGYNVTAVDISPGMLQRLRHRLALESREVAQRVEMVEQDVVRLDLGERKYHLIILPFNSLMCVPSFEGQLATIGAARRHLAEGGRLVLDLMNPFVLSLAGDPAPKPFFTRRQVDTGRTYTRFAAMSPTDATQCQQLFGWYDELDESGLVHRSHYELVWRIIFRYELLLMLRTHDLQVESIEGGHQKEPFDSKSRKMFVIATPKPNDDGRP